MHLYIEQNTGLTEPVSSGVIKKLYELAVGGTLDDTSNLIGTVSVDVVSQKMKDYLENRFSPNFHINATLYSATFDDPVWEQLCIQYVGSNGVVTEAQMRALTNIPTGMLSSNSDLHIIDFGYCNFTSADWGNKFDGCTFSNLTTLIIGGDNAPEYHRSGIKPIMYKIGATHLDKAIQGPSVEFSGTSYGGSIDILGIKDIPTIGGYLTRGGFTIGKMYIWQTTPPLWNTAYGDNNNTNIGEVYVPVGYMQTYLNDTNFTNAWNISTLQSKIHEYDFSTDPDGIFTELKR